MNLRDLMKQWRTREAAETHRVVAFGSSNTAIGWHSDGRHGWPCWLACIFRASIGQRTQTLNAGIGGDTAANLLQRVHSDVLPIRPHLVIVTVGGNDFFQRRPPADFEADLRSLDSILRTAGAAVAFQTYYAFLPEAGDGFTAYMDVVRRVAATTDTALIDQYAWFLPWQQSDPDGYRAIMRDPAHLKPIGNAVFATLAGRTCGLWDPAFPPDLPAAELVTLLERHGAPARNITLPE